MVKIEAVSQGDPVDHQHSTGNFMFDVTVKCDVGNGRDALSLSLVWLQNQSSTSRPGDEVEEFRLHDN